MTTYNNININTITFEAAMGSPNRRRMTRRMVIESRCHHSIGAALLGLLRLSFWIQSLNLRSRWRAAIHPHAWYSLACGVDSLIWLGWSLIDPKVTLESDRPFDWCHFLDWTRFDLDEIERLILACLFRCFWLIVSSESLVDSFLSLVAS